MYMYMYVTGNEGSAFVEVLVGRSSAPDDYKVYICTHACTCYCICVHIPMYVKSLCHMRCTYVYHSKYLHVPIVCLMGSGDCTCMPRGTGCQCVRH